MRIQMLVRLVIILALLLLMVTSCGREVVPVITEDYESPIPEVETYEPQEIITAGNIASAEEDPY